MAVELAHLAMTFKKIDWSDEIIEEFWRYWIERPETYFTESLGDTIVQFAKKNLGDLGLVMDFGSGSGGLLSALSRRSISCHGLEFGQRPIDRLNEKFAGNGAVGTVIGIDDSPNFEGRFDTVFFIEAIEHMPDRHLMPAMAQILSILKPGGWLLVTTPNDEDLDAAEVYCPVSQIAFHPMQHLRSWNRTTLAQHLSSAGFGDIKCFETDLQAQIYHSKSEFMKRLLKRAIYKHYKDPHLVAYARKPNE